MFYNKLIWKFCRCVILLNENPLQTNNYYIYIIWSSYREYNNRLNLESFQKEIVIVLLHLFGNYTKTKFVYRLLRQMQYWKTILYTNFEIYTKSNYSLRSPILLYKLMIKTYWEKSQIFASNNYNITNG